VIIARELGWEMNILSADERAKEAAAVAQTQAEAHAERQARLFPKPEDKDARKVDGFIVRDMDEEKAIGEDYVWGMILIIGPHGPLGDHLRCNGKFLKIIDVPWMGGSKMMPLIDIR